MSRKHKHKHHNKPAAVTPADLRARVVRLKGEGRFQQALELAKQLYKLEPMPAHLELLKEVYLGRARQLRGQGYDRDALTVLEVAQRIDEANPAWLGQLAAEFALCGEAGRAIGIMGPKAKAAVPALIKALKDPETAKLIQAQAIQIVASTPEDFAAFIKRDVVLWRDVAKQAKIQIQ